jgi:hypothetical protein
MGPPGFEFPTVIGRIEKLRLLMLVRERCPSRSRSRTTPHRLVSVSALLLRASRCWSGARPLCGPGAWFGGFSSPPLHVEVIRSLKFLGEPLCEHAPLYDPDPVTRLRFSAKPLLPSTRADGVGFRVTSLNFGAPSRGLFTRCVRFAWRVTPPYATLASSRAPPFAGQDSDLSGSR